MFGFFNIGPGRMTRAAGPENRKLNSIATPSSFSCGSNVDLAGSVREPLEAHPKDDHMSAADMRHFLVLRQCSGIASQPIIFFTQPPFRRILERIHYFDLTFAELPE